MAPSRPQDAPDVDYGGKHPFDVHRHKYERIRSVSHVSEMILLCAVMIFIPTLFIANRSTRKRRAQTEPQTTPLHTPTDHLYQPLRIAFDSSDLRAQMELALGAGDTLAATKLFLLIYEILPSTAEVWGDILRVIPVVGGIYPLDAVGSSVDVTLPSETYDETECTGETNYCFELINYRA